METKFTKDYILLIDEEAKSKEFDYYLDSTNSLQRRGSNKYGQGFDDVEKMIYCNHIHRNDKVIVAYRKLNENAKELDLPLLPNPFDPLERRKFIHLVKNTKAGERGNLTIDVIRFESLEDAESWCKGKSYLEIEQQEMVASLSKQFSLEDLKKAIEIAYSKGLAKPNSGRLSDIPKLQEEIIQSLSTQQTYPKSFIPEYEKDCPYDFTSRCTMDRCDCKIQIKTITNSEGKQEIQGTYKY